MFASSFMTADRGRRPRGSDARGIRRAFGTLALALVACASLGLVSQAHAQFSAGSVPQDGPNPSALSFIDSYVPSIMAADTVTAMTVAVMYNGRVYYERGFGWHDYYSGSTRPVLRNDVMRVASMTKFLVAAAIGQLVTDGTISWTSKVFEYGNGPGGGILPASIYSPYGGNLGDSRLPTITVDNLIRHRGGWDRYNYFGPRFTQNGFDPMFNSTNIADSMGVPHPAGDLNTVNFMLTQPLRFQPGDSTGLFDGQHCYSNFGYMLLDRIIQQVTGMTSTQYIQANILPQWGGDVRDLLAGETFAENQDPREPRYYFDGAADRNNVYYPTYGPQFVEAPYGGWDLNSMAGHGNLVTNAITLLHGVDNYQVWYEMGTGNTREGTPLGEVSAGYGGFYHTGALDGTNALGYQHSNGLRVAIIANRRDLAATDSIIANTLTYVTNQIGSPATFGWPSTYATDNWVDFAAGGGGDGTFASPMNDIPTVLPIVQTRGRVQIKPGTTLWTGTISQAVRLEAPIGVVRIGGN